MSRPGTEKGAILLLAVLGLIVLLLFAGLTIDSGLLQLEKARLQTAADAAALGAARELGRAGGNTLMEAARADAARNGYRQTASGATRLTVRHPPETGRYAGDSDAVEVIATHTGRTLMLPFPGTKTAVVAARAVGRSAAGSDQVVLGE